MSQHRPRSETTEVAPLAHISAVMPTRNRCEAALRNVRRLLDDPLIGEVIVVVDGCDDRTEVELRKVVNRERLKVVVHPVSRGPEVSRNEGGRRARCAWVAFLDDDDQFPADYFARLLEAAERTGADLVSARWVHGQPGSAPHQGWRALVKALLDRAADGSDPFPVQGCRESIWINSNYIVRRSYANRASYDESLRGSFWRDETDVAVSVARAGGRVFLTGDTFSYMATREQGGIDRRNRLRYDLSILVNEAHFLRRHGRWLKEHGYIRGVRARYALSIGQRLMALARDVVFRLGGI